MFWKYTLHIYFSFKTISLDYLQKHRVTAKESEEENINQAWIFFFLIALQEIMFFIFENIPVIRDKRWSQVYWDLLQHKIQKGLYVNFLTEIHTICFGILCSLCQCWKIFLPGLFLKISEWNSRPCMEKLMWWMVEYSVTNNSFELELNGNNLVKFVDWTRQMG